jgi:hypothetical protein
VLDITLHLAASIRKRPTAAGCGARRVYSAMTGVGPHKLGSGYVDTASGSFTQTSAGWEVAITRGASLKALQAPEDRVIAVCIAL